MLDLIYPPCCPVCRQSVPEQGAWCAGCLQEIVSVRLVDSGHPGKTALDSCLALGRYEGGLQRLLRDMKFRRQSRQAVYLTWLLKRYAPQPAADVLLPVPLHKARQRQRGYNQTELIFAGWARQCQLNWQPNWLQRIRATTPQWELTSQQRQQNLTGAFALGPQAQVQGKRILLADDLVTTGLTLEECAKVLKMQGAMRVEAIVLASDRSEKK